MSRYTRNGQYEGLSSILQVLCCYACRVGCLYVTELSDSPLYCI